MKLKKKVYINFSRQKFFKAKCTKVYFIIIIYYLFNTETSFCKILLKTC